MKLDVFWLATIAIANLSAINLTLYVIDFINPNTPFVDVKSVTLAEWASSPGALVDLAIYGPSLFVAWTGVWFLRRYAIRHADLTTGRATLFALGVIAFPYVWYALTIFGFYFYIIIASN